MEEVILGSIAYLLFSFAVALMIGRFISVGNPDVDYEEDSRE